MINATPDTESDPVRENGESASHGGLESDALRSAFGFDRSDDVWMALVRESADGPPLGRLGPYELLAEIGRGAQGAVYKAVQPGTQRVVAIKRLAAGALATAAMRVRFEREVEAVCRLSHPGIVTVHGVEVIDGQPLLTMEYVDGTPIDRWAAGKSRAQALFAFADACDAVAHAHQRAVLHRDLKPSNILVDSQGRPRVLDFGLAKLIGPDDGGSVDPSTSRGSSFVGTPAYASPEQIGADPDAVDTRSDVYSLGVVLYRLLTGRLPFDIDGGLPELFDQIRRGVQRPPSAVCRALGRELDAIVLKATALKPEHRYASVDALGADVRRHLAGEVVLAHPPGALYQLRKIVARHRFAFGLGGAAVVAIGALTLVLGVQSSRLAVRGRELGAALGSAQEAQRRAQQEAARTTASAEFLRDMIASLGRSVAAGQSQPERGMLREARARLESGELADQPELAVTMWRTLATTAHQLGLVSESAEFTQRATELCEKHLGPDHAEAGRCQLLMGLLAEGRSASDQAEAMYRSAADTLARTLGAEARETAQAINNLGCILKDLGRFQEAEGCQRRALATRLRLFGPVHRDVAMSYRNLGTLRVAQRRLDEADELYRNALGVALEAGGASDNMVLTIRTNIARLAIARGRQDEAERLFRENLEIQRRVFGADSITPAGTLFRLGALYAGQKRWDEAVGAAGEAREVYSTQCPADHPARARVVLHLGTYLVQAGRPAEAEPVLREAMGLASGTVPASPSTLKEARRRLAECLSALGRGKEAARLETEPLPAAPEPSAPAPDERPE